MFAPTYLISKRL